VSWNIKMLQNEVKIENILEIIGAYTWIILDNVFKKIKLFVYKIYKFLIKF